MVKRVSTNEIIPKRFKIMLDAALPVVCRWLAERRLTNSALLITCKSASGMFGLNGEFTGKTYAMLTNCVDISLNTCSWFIELNFCPFELIPVALRNRDLNFYFYWKRQAGVLCRQMKRRVALVAVQTDDFSLYRAIQEDEDVFAEFKNDCLIRAGERGCTTLLDHLCVGHQAVGVFFGHFESKVIINSKTLWWILDKWPLFSKNWKREYHSHAHDPATLRRICERSSQPPYGIVAKYALYNNRMDVLEWYIETGQKTAVDCVYISKKTTLELFERYYENRNPAKTNLTRAANLMEINPTVYNWLAQREAIPITGNNLIYLQAKIPKREAEWVFNNSNNQEFENFNLSGTSLGTLQWLDSLGFKFTSDHFLHALQEGRVDACRWLMEKGISLVLPLPPDFFLYTTKLKVLDLLEEIIPDREILLALINTSVVQGNRTARSKRIKTLVERQLLDRNTAIRVAFRRCKCDLLDWLMEGVAQPFQFDVPKFSQINKMSVRKMVIWLGTRGYRYILDHSFGFNYLPTVILDAFDSGFVEHTPESVEWASRHCTQRVYMEVVCWKPSQPRYSFDQLLVEFKKVNLSQ